ncbi:LYR motif-containing protein 5 [Aphelenchoides avenae]|nr:LYR motif-containing protein 5 [Aphelenchus avenae]
MAGKYRSEVVQLYKNLYYLGREYPKGARWFHDRLHTAFLRNRDETDEKKVAELLKRGRYVEKELETLYGLRKYRAMKERYYSEEEPPTSQPPATTSEPEPKARTA